MAREEDQDNREQDTEPKRGIPVWVWVCFLALLQVLLTAAGFYLFSFKTVETSQAISMDPTAVDEPEEDLEQEALEQELEEGEELLGAIYPLELFIVNLKDQGYVRVEVQLEFTEREIPRRIYSRMPMIRDAIIEILAQKTRENMLSSQGRKVFKKDIQTIINDRLRKEVIKNVYFTQYIIR